MLHRSRDMQTKAQRIIALREQVEALIDRKLKAISQDAPDWTAIAGIEGEIAAHHAETSILAGDLAKAVQGYDFQAAPETPPQDDRTPFERFIEAHRDELPGVIVTRATSDDLQAAEQLASGVKSGKLSLTEALRFVTGIFGRTLHTAKPTKQPQAVDNALLVQHAAAVADFEAARDRLNQLEAEHPELVFGELPPYQPVPLNIIPFAPMPPNDTRQELVARITEYGTEFIRAEEYFAPVDDDYEAYRQRQEHEHWANLEHAEDEAELQQWIDEHGVEPGGICPDCGRTDIGCVCGQEYDYPPIELSEKQQQLSALCAVIGEGEFSAPSELILRLLQANEDLITGVPGAKERQMDALIELLSYANSKPND